jgi:hypothetical protein
MARYIAEENRKNKAKWLNERGQTFSAGQATASLQRGFDFDEGRAVARGLEINEIYAKQLEWQEEDRKRREENASFSGWLKQTAEGVGRAAAFSAGAAGAAFSGGTALGAVVPGLTALSVASGAGALSTLGALGVSGVGLGVASKLQQYAAGKKDAFGDWGNFVPKAPEPQQSDNAGARVWNVRPSEYSDQGRNGNAELAAANVAKKYVGAATSQAYTHEREISRGMDDVTKYFTPIGQALPVQGVEI